MNRGKAQVGGYTIVEVMIFLAVSAGMFFVAMGLVGGQQGKIQFVNAVRDFESKINDVSNNVASGYYVKNADFTCFKPASGKVQFSSSNTEQGSNSDCIFAGTVLKFGDDTATNGETFAQLTMAGFRTSAGKDVKSLAESQPQVLFQSSIPEIISQSNVGYGSRVVCVRINNNACDSVNGSGMNAALGFFTTFTGTDLGSSRGGIQTDLLYFPGVRFNQAQDTTINAINAVDYLPATVNSMRATSVTICIRSGSTNEYALISLGGGSSSNLTVSSEIKQINGTNPLCT